MHSFEENGRARNGSPDTRHISKDCGIFLQPPLNPLKPLWRNQGTAITWLLQCHELRQGGPSTTVVRVEGRNTGGGKVRPLGKNTITPLPSPIDPDAHPSVKVARIRPPPAGRRHRAATAETPVSQRKHTLLQNTRRRAVS